MANWEIRSFHLNIDEGDSAVHFRCWKDANSDLLTVQDAVLIDGGLKQAGLTTISKFFCEALPNSNELVPSPSRTLSQMDAIVVTHWDQDHVAGLEGLFEEDLSDKLERYLRKFGRKKEKVPSARTLQRDLDRNGVPEELRSIYSVFDSQNRPETQLWSPYWKVCESKTTPQPKATPSRLLDRWTPVSRNHHELSYVRIKISIDHNLDDYTVKIPILKLEHQGRSLIGRDLFTGNCIITAEDAKSPASIAAQLKVPAMVCIAADFGSCDPEGDDRRATMAWKTNEDLTEIQLEKASNASTPTSLQGPASFFNVSYHDSPPLGSLSVNGPTTANNQASVAAMIIWPGKNKTPRISHYFAGDIGSREFVEGRPVPNDIEERILRWSTVPKSSTGNTRLPVTVESMKLSHHGGKYSTPLRMFFVWRPVAIVGSNGMRKSYNHCSWETILLVWMYANWRFRSLGEDIFPLFCTNLPIYLVNFQEYKKPNNGTQMSIEYAGPGSVGSLTSAGGKGFHELWAAFRDLYPEDAAVFPDFGKPSNTNARLEAAQNICKFIADRWDYVSRATINNYSLNGKITNTMVDSCEQNIRYIKITATGDSSKTTGIAVRGASMGATEPDEIPDEESGSDDDENSSTKNAKTNQSSHNLFWRGRYRRTHYGKANVAANPGFQQNPLGVKRRRQPRRPACSATAYNILQLAPDPKDDNDGGEEDVSSGVNHPTRGRSSTQRRTKEWDIIALQPSIYPLDETIYLVASDAIAKPSSLAVSSLKVESESNLDCFLGNLTTAGMVLTSSPIEASKAIPLDQSDETFTWLTAVFGEADSKTRALSASVSVASGLASIQGFSYTTQLQAAYAPKDKTKISAADKAFFGQDMVFSSAANKDVIGAPDGTWPSDPTDVVGPSQVLCVSLVGFKATRKTPTTVSASGLLNMLGLQTSAFTALLTGQLSLTLDMAKGRRNALWFQPGAAFSTTLRLEFSADVAALTKPLMEFLGKTTGNDGGFGDALSTPNSVQVIAKKLWSKRLPSGEMTAKHRSEITVLADFVLDPKDKKVPITTAVVFGKKTVRWALIFGSGDDQKPVSDVVAAICNLFKVDRDQDDFKLEKYLPGADAITLRRVEYWSRTVKKVTKRSLTLSIQVNFAGLVFLCVFTIDFGPKVKFNLRGSLFPENRPDPTSPLMTWLEYLPDHEDWTSLTPKRKGSMALAPGDSALSDTGDLNSIYKQFFKASQVSNGQPVHALADLPPAPIHFQLVSINFVLDSSALNFSATVGSKNPDDKEAANYRVPVIKLMTAMLQMDVDWKKTTVDRLLVETRAELTSPVTKETALLNLSLGYYQKDSIWKLQGGVLGMTGSFMYTLFDSDCDLEMVDLLQHLSVSFDISYVYDKTGAGSSFDVDGRLHIGTFNFDFKYHHSGRKPISGLVDEKNPVWTFEASLANEKTSENSLLPIIDSLCGGELSKLLPEFVKESKVKPSDDAKLTQLKIVPTEKAFIFVFRLQLSDNSSVSFYQIKARRVSKTAPVAPTKRILMFSLDQLPSVTNIPIIGKLGQPFDEMQFFWASNGDPDSNGLSRDDIASINAVLPDGFAKVIFKDIAKPTPPSAVHPTACLISEGGNDHQWFAAPCLQVEAPKAQEKEEICTSLDAPDAGKDKSPVVLASGFHFCLIKQEKVLLDYAFGGKKKKKKPPGTTAESDENNEMEGSEATPLDKKLGPVTITALTLGVDLEKQLLKIKLSGTLKLGPLELSLIGFGVTFNFTGSSLKGAVKLPSVDFLLEGLALAFQRDPINIAGMFAYGKGAQEGEYYYKGAAAIGFKPWLFEGGGYYGVSKKSNAKSLQAMGWDEVDEDVDWAIIDPYALEELMRDAQRRDIDLLDADTFKSFFAFARLSGPIATIGYAEIRDVCGGFGYNTTIAFPTMRNITEFPFFKSPGDGGVAGALTKFLDSGWVANKEGSNWVAAGLTVNAFQTLTVTAVVVVEFGASVKMGIFGLATAEIPKPLPGAGGAAPFKFAVVQLGLSATYEFDVGILKIDGQLTPASFILDPSCHLTGGFALYSWLGEKTATLKGDWVFTIGGYHPSYSAPEQYPVPPRLGISWSYDSSINISGQAYFAVTPKCCMGGGSLHLTLRLGKLYAYFDAWADFLINYRPFQYMASGGISVGVQYSLDLWLVTIPINIHLGAQLYIQGPPMSGRVHVDFYVFGFDVNFGSKQARANAQIGFAEFYKLALQSEQNAKSVLPQVQELGEDERENGEVEEQADNLNSLPVHVISCLNGLVPDTSENNQPKSSKWVVQGSVFVFSVSSKFAIKTAKVSTKGVLPPKDVDNPVKGNKICSTPMGLRDSFADSELTISIAAQNQAIIRSHPFRPLALSTTWESNVAQTRALPNALWASYDPEADPSGGNNSSCALLNGKVKATTEYMTGVQLTAPAGGAADDKIVPFDVEKAMSQLAETVAFLKVEPEDGKWKASPPAAASKDQYNAVKADWAAAAANVAQAVDFWAALSWNAAGPWTKMQGSPVGMVPEEMCSKLDGLYVEPPMISVA